MMAETHTTQRVHSKMDGVIFGCGLMNSEQPPPTPRKRLTELFFSKLTCHSVKQASDEPPEVTYSLSPLYDHKADIFVKKGVFRLNPHITVTSFDSTDTTRSTDTCTTIASNGDISTFDNSVEEITKAQPIQDECSLQTIHRAMCFDEDDDMSVSDETERVTNLSSLDHMRVNSLLSP